jgi:phosphopantetheine adenylyltransferase
MEHLYSAKQLETVINEATIYMCACPAQVADMLRKLRQLHDYQQNCIARESTEINQQVHNLIAQAAVEAHQIMETCMQEILRIEGWNPETLKMPENLREMLYREAMK